MDDLDNLPDPGALGRGREVTGQLESGRLVGSPQIESGHLKLRDSSSETGIEDGLVRGDRGKCGEWWVAYLFSELEPSEVKQSLHAYAYSGM